MKRFYCFVLAVAIACLMAVSVTGCGGTGSNQNATVTAETFVTQSYLALQDVESALTIATKGVGAAYQAGQISEEKFHDLIDGIELVDTCWNEASKALFAYRIALDTGMPPNKAAWDAAWKTLIENRDRLVLLLKEVPALAGLLA